MADDVAQDGGRTPVEHTGRTEHTGHGSARPWRSAAAEAYARTTAERLAPLAEDELDSLVFSLVEEQERHVGEECVQLYAGTNVPNPRAARLLGSPIGCQPDLGPPGDTYNRGMAAADTLRVLTDTTLARLFGARYVETRVPSGSLANLYAFMATCRPGDRILSFSDAAAGHPTHHPEGAAGLYGLEVHEVPFDAARMDVDVDGLRATAHRLRPRLIIVAGSMCLFPYSVSAVRSIADEIGARVLYDAAHMGGMIAGRRFQDPLSEGAHLVTGSTYKSFGGPPSGMVLTNEPELAERLDAIAYPGLTANFDLGRTAALALAALDLLRFGEAYADACLANARTLAESLAASGVDVFSVPGKGFTASQHVAVAAHAYGGGDHAAKVLERSGVLLSSISLPLPPVEGDANALRIGTQEVTRRGMGPRDMVTIAGLIAQVLVKGEPPEAVRPEVAAFRRSFTGVHFVA